MSDKLTPAEEQAIDALLTETLGGEQPPDLSRQILERHHAFLENGSVDAPTQPRPAPVAVTPSPARRDQPLSRITTTLAGIAALAATILLAIWLRPETPQLEPGPAIAADGDPTFGFPDAAQADAVKEADAVNKADAVKPTDASPKAVAQAPQPEATPPQTPRGIPLDLPSEQTPGAASERVVATEQPETQPAEPVALVSRQVDAQLQRYWEDIGIDPAGDASGLEIAAKLETILGVGLSVDSLADPKQLQDDFSENQSARSIAVRWLRAITDGGLSRVDTKRRQALISELAECFQSGKPFDQTLAAWIDGSSERSETFYASLSHGPAHSRGEAAMARRLASLTMNIDMRCTRCHDAYIEGTGRQQDHWTFTAFLRSGVKLASPGKVTLNPNKRNGKPLFFELADGRQGIAEPQVSAAWLPTASGPVTTLAGWSRSLRNSPALARGVVNSLWQLVHGRPLRGRVVDPLSAPHNEALDQLEQGLVDDLIRSRFHVGRTLALIVTAPATRRGIPAALLPENALVANETTTAAAKDAVNAFAAATPTRPSLTMTERLGQAMRASGNVLGDGTTIVGQIGNTGNQEKKPVSVDASLSVDLPGAATSLPVQWLARIDEKRSQVDHLVYLAGFDKVPANVAKAADKMRESDGDETALNRVWWTLRP